MRQTVLRAATITSCTTQQIDTGEKKMAKARWMEETKKAANDCETNMPWARGLRRQAMIARRLETDTHTNKITLPPMPAFMSLDISA
ncbi:MAG: hypothetical protein ACI9ND_001710 [Yoonia sp.]|jgi:hypothetical protein